MSIRLFSSSVFYQELEKKATKNIFIDYVTLSRKNRPPIYKKAGIYEFWGRTKFNLSYFVELASWRTKYGIETHTLKNTFTEHYRKFLDSFRKGSHDNFIPLVTEELYLKFFKKNIVHHPKSSFDPIAIKTKIRSASSFNLSGITYFQANVEFKYAFGNDALKYLEGTVLDKILSIGKSKNYETAYVTFEKAGSKSPWRICGRVEEGDSYYTIPK